MPAKKLTLQLRNKYAGLYTSAQINPSKQGEINSIVKRILDNRSRYEQVAALTGVPWYFISLIHQMEASGNFKTHLHNGDPLTARTVQVPAGRPKPGTPPFTWEESAMDALEYEGFKNVKCWSASLICFRLEKYNGFGYRNKGINSPYLWSYSQHYTKGKYVLDGSFNPNAVSNQAGAISILKQLLLSTPAGVALEQEPESSTPALWKAKYDPKVINPVAVNLQQFLNQFGYNLNPDGQAGKMTSDAVFEFTGKFMPGDPRIA